MVVKKLFDEFGEETIRKYVQKNADYYIAKWKLMSITGSKISWNWAAFFFTSLWFGYRKMYFYGFLYITFNLLSFIPLYGILIWLVLWFGTGMFGNYLYAIKTYQDLMEIKVTTHTQELFEKRVVEKGGTTFLGVLLMIVFGLIIYYTFMYIMMAYYGGWYY